MMSAFMKRVAVVAAGSTALTLGLGSAAQAIGFSITAQTNGIDSGFDRVQQDLGAAASNAGAALAAGAGGQLGAPFADALTGLGAGLSSGGGNEFFSVGFQSSDSNAFIRSLTFDLGGGGDTDASFDNQDFLLFDATPQVGRVFGIDPNDISFSAVGRNGFQPDGSLPIFSTLTVSFADGAFSTGKGFTFGADTNGVGDDSISILSLFNSITGDNLATFNDGGADFGQAGVKLLAEVASRDSSGAFQTANVSGIFSQIGEFSSQAQIVGGFALPLASSSAPPTSVPTPALLPGLLGFGASLLKKRRKMSEKAS